MLTINDVVNNIFEKDLNIKNIDNIDQSEHGVTNQTYFVSANNNKYVVRIPGFKTNEYINRENEIINMNVANKLINVPKIYYSDSKTGIIISQFLFNSKVLDKSVFEDDLMINKICDLLDRLHQSHVQFRNYFDIAKEIERYKSVLIKMNTNFHALENEYKETLIYLDSLLSLLLSEYPVQKVPCHIDPKLSNFLLYDSDLFLIDWEYSGMADLYFELANFSLTNELTKDQEDMFLVSYCNISSLYLDWRKFYLYKIVTDYLWIYWHLIKLYQGQNVKYNEKKWKQRLNRAIQNVKIMEAEKLL